MAVDEKVPVLQSTHGSFGVRVHRPPTPVDPSVDPVGGEKARCDQGCEYPVYLTPSPRSPLWVKRRVLRFRRGVDMLPLLLSRAKEPTNTVKSLVCGYTASCTTHESVVTAETTGGFPRLGDLSEKKKNIYWTVNPSPGWTNPFSSVEGPSE